MRKKFQGVKKSLFSHDPILSKKSFKSLLPNHNRLAWKKAEKPSLKTFDGKGFSRNLRKNFNPFSLAPFKLNTNDED